AAPREIDALEARVQVAVRRERTYLEERAHGAREVAQRRVGVGEDRPEDRLAREELDGPLARRHHLRVELARDEAADLREVALPEPLPRARERIRSDRLDSFASDRPGVGVDRKREVVRSAGAIADLHEIREASRPEALGELAKAERGR